MANSKNKILQALETQTAVWIVLGAVALILYPIVFLNWDLISSFRLTIPLAALAIAGTMLWWFWTMRIILAIIRIQKEEDKSFGEIIKELKEIRSEIQKEIREQNNK
jgi:ABC-type thiamin/hydroxymethylpyrimidine transport system permease subunit